MFGLTLASWLSGYAWSIFVEIVSSFGTGLAAGCVYSATVKVLTSIFIEDELPVAIGYYSIAWPLAIVLTGLVLPFFAHSLGWRWPYYVLAFVCFVIAVLVFSTTVAITEKKIDFLVIKNPNVILLSLAGFVFYFGYWLLALYAYLYLLSVGLSIFEAGLVYSMLAVAGLPSTAISGHVMKRLGAKRTLSITVMIYGTLLLVFSLARNIYALMFVTILMGFFRFMVTPATTTVISLVGGKQKAGSVSGVTNFFAQASGIVGPIAASLMIQRIGYSAVWVTAFLLSAVASLLYSRVKI